MTQTLTTERQQFEEWFNEEIVLHISASNEAVARLMWKAWQASRELLANREAQPVYQFIYNNPYEEGYTEWVDCNKEYFKGVPKDCRRILYTAPPAPAVPDESDPRDAFESAFPMPKYVVRCGTGYAVTAYSAWGAHDFKERWKGWNACRAAMLAQPVSSGYKLPEGFKLMPLEMTDEIGEAIAMEARCCGGIALCIYEAALAAAPDNKN